MNKKNGEFAVYRRILRIDELIASDTYPNIKDLMEDHEIEGSRATIYRTIEKMKAELHAPIEYDYDKKGFYYTEKTFRLPTIFTTGQEMFAIAMLQNMVSNLEGTPIYESAKTVLEAIQTSTVKNPNSRHWLSEYHNEDKTNLEWTKNRYVFLDNNKLSIPDSTWKILEVAFKENRIIEFDYSGNWNQKVTHRKVKPYQAVFSDSAWYLWCFDCDKNGTRLFNLNRLADLKLTSQKFTLPKDYDFKPRADTIFGAFTTDYSDMKFSAQFWNEAIPYIKERTWGKKQTIKNNPDGSITLTFTGNQWVPFLRLVLSFGMNAKLLSPQDLAEEWKENIQSADLD